ncbi:MAG: histidine--tRNA ligase [Candidatus Bathyarchaeota archaeon]|nr:histidine--tRNA ligase [Candidatus Bathyarchaeota archaeon]
MPTFQTVRGMRDLLPEDAAALNCVIAKARETAGLYGYREIVTPVVEPYELLAAKSGEEIRQRMFTFKDLGDRTVALRPEFTASIARLATTALRNEPKPLRVFSVGSVYRYDEPQRGRYREFWQSDFEIIGSNKPEADAEIILLTNSLMQAVGLRNYAFKLGHIGVLRGILSQEDVDDKTQNAVLQRMDKKEYTEAFALVPEKCRATLEGLLKLKSGSVFETAERIIQYVADYSEAAASAENLLAILKLVTEGGCEIATVEPAFARGLEYYTGMIFEVYIPELDIALGGGGRYDRLIEVFGGEATPATGVAHGLDRIALAMQTQNLALKTKQDKRVVVVPVKDEQKGAALKIAQQLRATGMSVEFEVMGRKMAKALEDADKRQMDYAVIVGEKELQQNTVVLRNLAKRTQTTVVINKLAEAIRS